MNLIDKVKNSINKYKMLQQGECVLIALSGGPDSVCLLHVLKELSVDMKLTLNAIYVDHGLRPDEIPMEIEFCRKLSNSMGIPFNIKKIAPMLILKQKHSSLNLQESARKLRYEALQDEALRVKADKIATGHNADDQAETFIMRLLRGSGPAGLSSIPPVRGNIIRPLIEIEKSEIENYLKNKKLSYIIDSSNLKDCYLRNKIRREIIPLFKKYNPNFINTLLRTAEILRQENDYIELKAAKVLVRLINRKEKNKIELFLAPLENLDKVLLRRVLRIVIDKTEGLRSIGYEHIEEIINLIHKSETGARIYLPNGIRAIKRYSTLLITAEPHRKLGEYILNPNSKVVIKEAAVVLIATITENTNNLGDGKKEAVFDADKLNFPLKIRPRKKGDFFYPFGLGKRKKLKDFFIDEKLPLEERDLVPILTSSDDIIWVIGYRIDDRYKVMPSTKNVLRVLVKPSNLIFSN